MSLRLRSKPCRFGIEHDQLVGVFRLEQERVRRIAQPRARPGSAVEEAMEETGHARAWLRTRRDGNDMSFVP